MSKAGSDKRFLRCPFRLAAAASLLPERPQARTAARAFPRAHRSRRHLSGYDPQRAMGPAAPFNIGREGGELNRCGCAPLAQRLGKVLA